MIDSKGMAWRAMTAGLLVFIGCRAMAPAAQPDSETTDRMREACPMLTDEVLDGFVLAVSGLRDNGLSEAEALQQWVEGCDRIPPDGNFEGDVEACRACLPVIVEAVYGDGVK